MPLVEIPNARFRPCMNSFLGALAGVLVALDDEHSMDELWGLSSWGFRTHVHRTLEPVGLLGGQWDKSCAKVLHRVGYDCNAGLRDHFYSAKDLHDLQFVWMNNVERALDDGRPVICFGLHGPAFGIIRGLDTDVEEYHVSTFMDGRKDDPINVQDVGSQNPQLIFMLIPTGPLHGYDPNHAARDAIKEAIDHHLGQERDAEGKAPAVPPDLVEGVAAYNAWSTAIETGQVQPYWALTYYAGYYAEARSAAATWLKRLTDNPVFSAQRAALELAASHLEHEVESFSRLSRVFPLQEPQSLNESTRRTEASACLRMARAEHIAGIEALAAVFGHI
jgi:hypothetical protein